MNVRVEDFNIAVGFDLARQHLARHSALDAQCLWPHPVQLKRNALEVEDDVGGVFDDTGDRREFVQYAFDLDRRDGGAFDRREQRPAQAVADGGPEPALEWLRVEFAVAAGRGLRLGGEALRLLESNHELGFGVGHCFPSDRLWVSGGRCRMKGGRLTPGTQHPTPVFTTSNKA